MGSLLEQQTSLAKQATANLSELLEGYLLGEPVEEEEEDEEEAEVAEEGPPSEWQWQSTMLPRVDRWTSLVFGSCAEGTRKIALQPWTLSQQQVIPQQHLQEMLQPSQGLELHLECSGC